MKNDFKILGDKTIIYLNYKGETVETVINTDKLERAIEFPNVWYGAYDPMRKRLCVQGHLYLETGETRKHQTSELLHRWILDVKDKNIEVDHYDNDPLNNTNENLRLVSRAENLQNRTIQSNNTSGYRGVTFHKKKRKWQASVYKNKKQIYLGIYETAEEANEVVKKWREENYPFSKEATEKKTEGELIV